MTWSILSGERPASDRALLDGPDDAVDERRGELVELGPREVEVEVLGTVLVGADEGQVDVAAHRGRELDLGLLGGLVEALQGHLVFAQVDAVLALELGDHPVDDGLVEVVAAQVGVAVGRLDLEDAVAQVEDRDVEGAAAQVEHEDGLVVLFVEAVGQRGRGGLVDDALDLDAGDLAGVLGGLALGVVEVGRHGDDRFADLLAQVLLGVAAQLLQDHRRDLGRRVELALDVDGGVAVGGRDHLVRHDLHLFGDVAVLAAHEALDREHGVLGVGDGLAPGDRAHEAFAALGEGDDRRGGATAFGVRDDRGLTTLEDAHATERRPQVDSDYFGHACASLAFFSPS